MMDQKEPENSGPGETGSAELASDPKGPDQNGSPNLPIGVNGSCDIPAKPGEPDDKKTNGETNQTTTDSGDATMDEIRGDEDSKTPEVPATSAFEHPDVQEKGTEGGENKAATGTGKKNPEPPAPAPVDDPADIYRQFVEITERNPSNDPGQTLVTGMVDYLRVVDERLRKIEEKLNTESPGSSSDSGKEETGTAPSEEKSKTDPNDIKVEAKFFEANEEDFLLDANLKDMAEDEGRFSSTKDQAQVLRVLYNRLADQITVDNANPDPEHVEVIYINILSDAIASFFRDMLGLDCGSGHTCVRLSKPFRPLIRNAKPLKDHLAKLEEAYRDIQQDVTKDNTDVNWDDSTIRADGDVDLAAGNNDPVPPTTAAEPISSEQPEKSFLRQSALGDFKVIVEFIDRYLGKSLDTYDRIASGLDDNVAFEDLWMLYEPGTTIYCPYKSPNSSSMLTFDALTERTDGTGLSHEWTYGYPRFASQAYCVLSSRGGIPLKKALKPGGVEEEEEDNDLLQNFDTFLKLEQLEIFRHGESGVYKKDGQLPGIRHGLGGAPIRRTKNTTSGLVVACFSIEYDGNKFGAQRELFEIKPYDGLKDVRSMQVYPVQYLEQTQRDRLLERGRKFVDLTNNAHMSYEGTTAGHARETINSEVIVDFKIAFEPDNPQPGFSQIRPNLSLEIRHTWPRTAMRGQGEVHDWYEHDALVGDDVVVHRWCYHSTCQKPNYYKLQDNHSQKLLRKLAQIFEAHSTPKSQTTKAHHEFRSYLEDNGFISLCPGVVPGYALRNRKWVILDMNTLQDVKHGDDWNNLVLPKGHKEMVQAMVESYTKRTDGTQTAHDLSSFEKIDMDLVRGKGKGCIILLHGAPGVGKTSTAECVAAYTKRPLYPITCGDIGHVPDIVEQNLEQHFKLAHKWACVLLLDEADVFLAKRTKTDVKRNGLVSVFLRILEYYPGILFLTTNRVGAIDDAFRSRLHLTLYYPKLLEKQSTKIWKNNIRKLKEVNEVRIKRGQEPIKYDKHEILKWAKTNWASLQWNGRQIRNAFQTAIALAEFKAQSRSSSKRTTTDLSSPVPKSPKKPNLNQDIFFLIAEASTQFNDYLLQTHGADEDGTALRDQTRLASFKQKPTKIKRVDDSSESETDSDASAESDDSKSSSPGSDIDSDATADSDDDDSDSESPKKKKKKKAKTAKGKTEKKSKKEKKEKEKKLSEDVEKTDKKKKKKSDS